MWGSTTDEFQFTFKYIDPSTRKVTWNRSTDSKKWSSWTASAFVSSFDYASGYHGT